MTRPSGTGTAARRHDVRLLSYLIATFAVSWGLWSLAALIPVGLTGRSVRPLYFLPGTFAPAIVGLWFTAATGGREAVAAMTRRVLLWTVPARWYVFALLYMIAAKLIVAVLYRLIASTWPEFGLLPWYLPFAIGLSTIAQAGEEIGWRGVALPDLAQQLGLRQGSIVLGAVWAVWHVPLFLIPQTDLTGQPFVPFFLGVTALSVPMAWLYVRTRGSLLLVMLMHAAVNNTSQLVPSLPPGGTGVDERVAWLTAGVLWLGALATLALMSEGDAGERSGIAAPAT